MKFQGSYDPLTPPCVRHCIHTTISNQNWNDYKLIQKKWSWTEFTFTYPSPWWSTVGRVKGHGAFRVVETSSRIGAQRVFTYLRTSSKEHVSALFPVLRPPAPRQIVRTLCVFDFRLIFRTVTPSSVCSRVVILSTCFFGGRGSFEGAQVCPGAPEGYLNAGSTRTYVTHRRAEWTRLLYLHSELAFNTHTAARRRREQRRRGGGRKKKK